jgi:hypothetical protein
MPALNLTSAQATIITNVATSLEAAFTSGVLNNGSAFLPAMTGYSNDTTIGGGIAANAAGNRTLIKQSFQSALASLLVNISSSGGSASRDYPADGNDVLVYHLDEAVGSTTWANSGTSGTNSLSLIGGTLTVRPGLYPVASGFGRGIYFRNVAQDRAEGAAGVEPAYPVTLSCWWYHRAAANGETLIAKLYRPDGSYSTPFVSMCLNADASNAFSFSVTVGGAFTTVSSNAIDAAIVGTWNLIVGVYDGTTMSLYVNGALSGSTSKTGAIDYGTHGPWTIGSSPPSAGAKTGILDEIRVANVARDVTWVENYWKTVMLLT